MQVRFLPGAVLENTPKPMKPIRSIHATCLATALFPALIAVSHSEAAVEAVKSPD